MHQFINRRDFCRTRREIIATARKISAAVISTLLCTLLLIRSEIQPADAQPTLFLGAATLSGAFDILQGKIEAVINSAANAADSVGLSVANDLNTTLSQARQTFQTELNLQEQQISNDANRFLQEFEGAEADAEKQLYDDAQTLLNQAQIIVDSTILSNGLPQIGTLYPLYIQPPPAAAPGLKSVVELQLKGNFPDTVTGATMTIGSTKIAGLGGNLSLYFQMPSSAFSFASNSLSSAPARIRVDYHKCYFLGFLNCAHYRDAGYYLTLLPPNPGSITFDIQTPFIKTNYQANSQGNLRVDASAGDNIDHPIIVQPTPGWNVVPSSVQFSVQSQDGDAQNGSSCTTGPSAACWTVTVRQHHCFSFICPSGHDGVIVGTMTWQESQDVNSVNVQHQTVQLGWNNSQLIELPPHSSWVGTLNRFDGAVQAFNSDYTDKLIEVRAASDSIVTKAFPFGDYLYRDNSAAAKQRITDLRSAAYTATWMALVNSGAMCDGQPHPLPNGNTIICSAAGAPGQPAAHAPDIPPAPTAVTDF